MLLSEVQSLHIELTTKCNARCPMCLRNISGYPFNAGYPLTELLFSDYKSILSTDFLTQIRMVTFSGNLGDFSVAKDADKILHYTADYVSDIVVSTNASTRTPEWWAGLVRDNVMIQFCIDGLSDTHSLYRLQTNYDKILENAQAFINAGGNAQWKMVKFKHNEHQIDDARKLSKKLGFTSFELIDHGRNQGAVYDTNGDFKYWIGDGDGRDNTPVVDYEIKSTLEAKINVDSTKKINCKYHLNGNQIYIAGDGTIYPCCFTGVFPDTMAHPGNEQLKNIVNKNNALEYPLEECLMWFDDLYKQWDSTEKPTACLLTCSNQ